MNRMYTLGKITSGITKYAIRGGIIGTHTIGRTLSGFVQQACCYPIPVHQLSTLLRTELVLLLVLAILFDFLTIYITKP